MYNNNMNYILLTEFFFSLIIHTIEHQKSITLRTQRGIIRRSEYSQVLLDFLI